MMNQKSLRSLTLCTALVASLLMGGQSSAQAPSQPADYRQYIPQQLLPLIHAPEVQQELNLSPGQIQKLKELFSEIDGTWFRARNLPAEKRISVVTKLESQLWQWFQKYGSDAQRKRLKQLEYRSQAIRMLLRDDLAQQLRLDATQRAELAKLAEATDQAANQLQMATMRGEQSEELKQALLKATQSEQEALRSLIRPEQMQQLSQILGEAFDTSKLKRIFPMAPELVPVKHWINSQPLTLEELRGKVVVLHFYAFQCHNCHANFDHYRKWHEQFGDDVVVLGIQTPETAMERDPEAVKSAAGERDLKFPILVDLASDNWKSWSNTMWPTVYVIDKNGYIRQWWQGELNWNGATGDEVIQKLITELLEEELDA
ncbi:MAG: redoxin domain-containing protein [bacterium]|nr:redoxin domain-containing protein [bacterium]